jgi:hypothetical protein
MRKMTFGLLMLVLVFMVGCAKPPEADIQSAKQSIEAAQQAQAGDYAPDSLKAAEDVQAQLDAELKAQEEKFALFRSYKKASELAAQVKAKGEQAATDAKTRKEQVKQEAQTLIGEAKAALTEAEEMLKKAPKGKGTQQDIEALKGDLTAATSTVTEAESAFTAERFLDAKAKAEAAKSSIGNVKTQIEQAMAAKKAAPAKGHHKKGK